MESLEGGATGAVTGQGSMYHRAYPGGEIELPAGDYLVWVCVESGPPSAAHVLSNYELVQWTDSALDSFGFTDRVDGDAIYKFTNLGGVRQDGACYFLRGRNDAKNTDYTAIQWSIRAPWPAVVYLDFLMGTDGEGFGFAKWPDRSSWTVSSLAGVESINEADGSTTGPGNVYSRVYAAGEGIELHGNDGDGAGSYLVFVCPVITDERISGDSHTTSVAECPSGSVVVDCATDPEQTGFKLVATSTSCEARASSNVMAIATCSNGGPGPRLHTSAHICTHLPTSAHICPHLPTSAHICPHLHTVSCCFRVLFPQVRRQLQTAASWGAPRPSR